MRVEGSCLGKEICNNATGDGVILVTQVVAISFAAKMSVSL
jgi:hypothetical protein